jgi:hypothetical protein
LQAHTLEHPPFTIAATSVPRRRRVISAAGEGQTAPPFFLSLLVRLGLTELVPPQVVDLEPSWSQFEDRWSTARSAAVAKFPRRRIPFVFELACFFFFAR